MKTKKRNIQKGIRKKLSEEERVTLDIIVHSSNYNHQSKCSKEIIKAGKKRRNEYFNSILSSDTLNPKIIKPLRNLLNLIQENEGLPIQITFDSTVRRTISAIYHKGTPEEIKTAYEKVRKYLKRLNGMDKGFFEYPQK